MTSERKNLLHAMLELEDELEVIMNAPITKASIARFNTVRDSLDNLNTELIEMDAEVVANE